MRTMAHQRRFGAELVIACLAGALAGCGNVSDAGSGMDAAAGGGRGGTTGTGGTTGAGGTTGTGGTTGVAGTTGTGGSGGGVGRGGTTGAAGIGPGRGGAGGGSGGAAGGTAGAGGSGVCNVLCTTGRTCCGGACVNLQNDPFNCGKCGNACTGTLSYCNAGTCQAPLCEANVFCTANGVCCGNSCCSAGQLCCNPEGPIGGEPTCYTPTVDQPTCPQGCAPLCKSDRNSKKNITPADTQAILDKVAHLPISNWTYNEEPSGVRHLGPMAQDFHAAFGLGSDDRTYNSVDGHGVALAAIQALERMLAAQEKRIDALERENRRLERRLRGSK